MKLAALIPLLMLSACMSTVEPEPQSVRLNSGYGLSPTDSVNHLSQRIVNSLVRNNDVLRSDQPLLVTTPVVLDSLFESNKFGLQLQQGMMTALHEHKFNLVDVNVADNMRVAPNGEFMLSRDWQQLPADVAVEHVLVSTMSMNKTGVVLNARIVNIVNNRVVSATQASVLQKELPEYIVLSPKVIAKDGLLYRNENYGDSHVRIIGDKQ